MNMSFKIQIISDHGKASWTKGSWARPSYISADAMPIHTVDFSGYLESQLGCVFSACEDDFPSQGWCGIEFKSRHYYEGFTLRGSPSGKGILFEPSGDFIEGSWTKDKCTDGFIHSIDGTLPLQYRCWLGEQNQTVGKIADALSHLGGVTMTTEQIASRIVESNKGRILNLSKTCILQKHSILRLPQELASAVEASSTTLKTAISFSDRPSRPHNFLVGSLVLVSQFTYCMQGTFCRDVPFTAADCMSPFRTEISLLLVILFIVMDTLISVRSRCGRFDANCRCERRCCGTRRMEKKGYPDVCRSSRQGRIPRGSAAAWY
jgi:hypothetical protein